MGMDHSLPTFRRFALTLLAATVATAANAQTTCYHFGSTPQSATLEPSPFALGCFGAAQWPSWHLWTPAHREPGPHAGYAPGDAIELPRWLVHWRCTGWLLLPVVPDQVRTLGYVIDQPEHPCVTP
jgi:hypothetical protein